MLFGKAMGDGCWEKKRQRKVVIGNLWPLLWLPLSKENESDNKWPVFYFYRYENHVPYQFSLLFLSKFLLLCCKIFLFLKNCIHDILITFSHLCAKFAFSSCDKAQIKTNLGRKGFVSRECCLLACFPYSSVCLLIPPRTTCLGALPTLVSQHSSKVLYRYLIGQSYKSNSPVEGSFS